MTRCYNACVDPTYSPVEVISAIRGYVEHFLGCRECAVNFGRGASHLLSGDRSSRYLAERDGAVIWLWQSHNRANRHLRSDITEDPSHPKVQFPLPTACPACHHGEHWNETAVLQYLVEYYGAESVIDDDIDNVADANVRGRTHFTRISSASDNLHCAWLLHLAVFEILLVVCMCVRIKI